MCNISSAPHFIDSDMSDNDVPIGNDNVEEAEGRKRKEGNENDINFNTYENF